MRQLLIALMLLLAIALTGCCGLNKCKCDVPSVLFVLQDSGAYCAGRAFGNTGVRRHDVFWNLVTDTKITSTGCGVNADWQGSPFYLVFYEDSLGLADTVQVISVTTEEGGSGDCCDCPGPVLGSESKINGVATSGNVDEVLLPF
jgi:hypothetical protein